jgi:hypothetical protein
MSGMLIYVTLPGYKKEPVTLSLTATIADFCRDVLQSTGFRIFEGFGFTSQDGTSPTVPQTSAFTKTVGFNATSGLPLVFDFYGATGTPAQATGTPSTASGTLGAATYFARYTFVNAAGESLPGAESTGLVVSAPGKITFDSPAANALATGWNVYVSTTSGSGWKLQNVTPTAVGSTFVLSIAYNAAGAVVPATDTTPIPVTKSVALSSCGVNSGDELQFFNVPVGG